MIVYVKIIHIIQLKNILFVFYLFSGVTDVQECGDPGALDYDINIEAFDYDIDLSARPELGRLAYNDLYD